MSLLTCWLGFDQVGLEPFPVRTHWVTTTNFMGLLPIPRFRAYLGATSAWFGWASHCASLADHLVRQEQNGRRKREPQGCRGLEVDDEMEPHDLLDRQVGWLGPFENLVHEFRRTAMHFP
jgi:hypothetical protein